MGISLRKLEIFVKVAETGHVTRVSEALMLSQSATSMALADLEKQAGSPLFHRRGGRLKLNERGRLLLPEAQEILRRSNHLENLMKESATEPMGELRIGASTTIGNYLLPSLMAKFSSYNTRAKACLQVGNTQQVESAVECGDLDLGLIEGPCHVHALEAIPWRNDELVVIAGNEHPWAKRGRATSDMLADADWIVREKGSGTREVFEAAMAGKVKEFTAYLELGHTEAIKKAVEAGLGVSCLSRLAVQRELDHNWLVAVKTPLELTRPLTILVKKNRYKSKLLEACLDLLLSSEPKPDLYKPISEISGSD